MLMYPVFRIRFVGGGSTPLASPTVRDLRRQARADRYTVGVDAPVVQYFRNPLLRQRHPAHRHQMPANLRPRFALRIDRKGDASNDRVAANAERDASVDQ